MTIFELKEKIEETKSDIKSLEREIKRNRESLEPRATDVSKEKVSGGSNSRTIDDVMSIILEAEKCRVDRIEEVYLDTKEEKIHEALLDDVKSFDNSSIEIK